MMSAIPICSMVPTMACRMPPSVSGDSGLVVDGARRYADLKASDQVVDLKADPWASGTNTIGGTPTTVRAGADPSRNSAKSGTV